MIHLNSDQHRLESDVLGSSSHAPSSGTSASQQPHLSQPSSEQHAQASNNSTTNGSITPTVAPATQHPEWMQSLRHAAIQTSIRLCGWLLGEGSVGLPQPRVTWRRNRRGESFYEIYDPVSLTTHRFETAQAARTWLETRYYR